MASRSLRACRITGLLAVCFLTAAPPASGQFAESGTRISGLGGAGTALPSDAWNETNPAAWAGLKARTVTFTASEAFGLSELRLMALGFAEVTRHGTFGVRARSFGFELYRDTRLAAGAARQFTLAGDVTLGAGLTIQYFHVSIDGYGSAGTAGLSAGWTLHATPDLTIGGSFSNLNRPQLAGREEFPRLLSIGAAYSPAPGSIIAVDVAKDNRFPPVLRIGAEVAPVSALALRSGFSADVTGRYGDVSGDLGRFSAGVGVRAGLINLDVAAERHYALGWSPAVSLSVQW